MSFIVSEHQWVYIYIFSANATRLWMQVDLCCIRKPNFVLEVLSRKLNCLKSFEYCCIVIFSDADQYLCFESCLFL